jgi:hypothetical protein
MEEAKSHAQDGKTGKGNIVVNLYMMAKRVTFCRGLLPAHHVTMHFSDINTQIKDVTSRNTNRHKRYKLKRQDPRCPSMSKALGIKNGFPFPQKLKMLPLHTKRITSFRKSFKSPAERFQTTNLSDNLSGSHGKNFGHRIE